LKQSKHTAQSSSSNVLDFNFNQDFPLFVSGVYISFLRRAIHDLLVATEAG
jgi:hypothetical protein